MTQKEFNRIESIKHDERNEIMSLVTKSPQGEHESRENYVKRIKEITGKTIYFRDDYKLPSFNNLINNENGK